MPIRLAPGKFHLRLYERNPAIELKKSSVQTETYRKIDHPLDGDQYPQRVRHCDCDGIEKEDKDLRFSQRRYWAMQIRTQTVDSLLFVSVKSSRVHPVSSGG